MTLWDTKDISFNFVDDMTEDSVVTLHVITPVGSLTFTAEPVMIATTLVLKGLHAQDSTPNAVGAGNLLVIAQAVIEGMERDGLVIKGAVRSTGANPGHRPHDIRFARRVRVARAAGRQAPTDD